MSISKLKCSGVGELMESPKLIPVSSTHICEFILKFKRVHHNIHGKAVHEYDYVTCTAWGSAAEYIYNKSKVGMYMYIDGQWRQERWYSKTRKEHFERNIIKVTEFSIQSCPTCKIKKKDEK